MCQGIFKIGRGPVKQKDDIADNDTPAANDQRYLPYTGSRDSLHPHGRRVLLVEDDRDLRNQLAEVLRMERYQVTCAENGEIALRILHHGFIPDLILLDVWMPVTDGLAFKRQVEADLRFANIPVVVLTADGQYARPHVQRDMAAQAYLLKPFDLSELLATVRGWCGADLGQAQQRQGR